jgi:tape measure domain-containing protein
MAAPELRLKVTLDTSFLKGQISRLPLDFAGANVSIRPKFDRQTIVNEFRLLNRYIGGKKFNITIASNLEAEIKNADRLVQALGRVQQAASGAKGGLPIGGRELSRTKSKGGFAAEEIKTLFGAAVQGGLIDEKTLGKTRDQMVTALSGIGRDSIAGLLNGLQSGNADLQKAAQMLGSNLISSFKGVLGIASPSREFKKIGEAAGQGFEQGLLSSMADAFDSLERQLGTKLQRLKAQAIAGTSGALAVSGRVSPVQVADVTPRDYARIAGSGPRAALPPGVDRSAATTQEFFTVMDRIGLAMANFTDTIEVTTATMQGLKKVIAALNNRALLSNHEQYRLFAQSLTKGQLPLLSGTASQQFPMLKAAGASPRADALRPQDRLLQGFLARTTKLLLPQGPGASGGRSVFTGKQFREIAGNLRRPQIGPGTDLTVKSIAIKDLTGIAESFGQLRTPLLPPVGGTTASERMRQQLSALPPLTAPSIGKENAPLSRAAAYSLNKANQLLGLPMGPSSPLGSMGQFPMSGMMGRGSLGQFPVDPMLAVGGASAMGQKVAGPYPWSNTARSARGGYIPGIGSSLQFPISGMMGPSSPLGRITPQSSMFAGGGGGGPGGGGPGGGGPGGGGPGGGGPGGGGGGPLGGMQFNVPQLPGSGLVREIGTEFAFAARQVLLFGTAYKALAFLQGFPGQVGNAVGALQSFRNTLGAISPSAAEAAASSQFILDVVDKYNTPIQSARDGFTKLYASMKPTGFSGDEIRDLFLGISQAAATFGMSADKVDRVNYAFAQMASKGQVMSEELKGQLGDVLPGAMGIFAEAAGFTGPEAITKFSKALEDGAYKGAAMKTLLTNVGSIMRKEFGPGAEGAARTFQGVMNRMQNSAKRFYEAFEPVAVGFLNSVVMPLTSGIKTVTDGFNAFFTGANAKTAGGFAFAQELEKLRPTFEGLRTNAIALAQVFGEFAKVALGVGSALLQIAGNPIVGFMAKIYAIMVPLNMALGVMRGLWALNSLQLLLFNARVAMGVPTLSAFRGMMQATGATAAVTATSIRTAGLTLRTFFASTGVGLILVGISLLIERFMSMNQALADTRAKALGAAQAIRSMTKTEAILDERKTVKAIKLLETLQTRKRSYEGSTDVSLTKSEASLLEDVGVPVNKGGFGGGQYMDPTMLESHKQRLETVNLAELTHRQRVISNDENEAKQAAAITPITGLAGDGTGKPPKEQSLESYYSLQDQLAKAQTQADIDRIEALFEHRKNMINSAYDLEEARANSIQKEAIAHQRAISNIFMDLQKKQIDARLSMMKAEGSVAGGAGAGAAPGSAVGAYLQGNIGPTSTGPHFDVKKVGGGYFPRNYLDQFVQVNGRPLSSGTTVPGGTFAGHQRRGSHGWDYAFGEGRHAATLTGGAKWQEGVPTQHGERRRFQLPSGEVFQFLHGGSEGIGAKTPGKVTPDQRRDVLADQAKVIAAKQATLSITHAEIEAQRQLVVETEKYLAQIFGVAEKELQAGMLQKKTAMLRAGATDQEIEDAMSLEELNLKYAAGVEAANRQIAFNNQLKEKGLISQEELNDRNAYQNLLIEKLNKELPKATQAQLALNKATKEYAFTGVIKTLQEEIKLLLIINDEERRIAELRKTYSASEAQEIFNLEKIKKNIEETRALIDGFVSSTTSDYKGFLKAVISGEDAADALKQFQEGLKDKVLTIFLDFAMAPVEKFLKESLEGLFLPKAKKEDGKLPGATTKDPVEATNINTTATNANTVALEKVAGALASAGGSYSGLSEATINQGFGRIGGASFGGMQLPGLDKVLENIDFETAFEPLQKNFGATLENLSSTLDTNAYSLSQSAVDYSANFKNVGDSAKKMAEDAGEAAEDAGRNGKDWQESLGKVASGIGIAAGAIMGIAAGISQIKKGGTGNTLMGIGSIMASVGGAIGGFTKLAGANGGVAGGGWKPFPVSAFANGGMVKGPTLGLVGEGKYNEAIVPLPDGRSIPVQMRGAGGSGSRDLLANQAQSRPSPSVLSMSFQSTTINGVEYVDRAQLEAAMEETRRAASREGANKGANLAIDRLANSPSSRRRAGIR